MFRLTMACLIWAALSAGAQKLPRYQIDRIEIGNQKMEIAFLGHGTLMIVYDKLVIHIDPVSQYADYARMPKADLILVTHEHQDHLDEKAIARILKKGTQIIANQAVKERLGKGTALANGDSLEVRGIRIKAVPAYNITPGREKFHPRGRDNGYVLTIGGKRIYIAGDTEDIPEMNDLKDIDIAFLPVNQPYTMTVQQAANAARRIKPKVLYPYHFGETDISVLPGMLKDLVGTEVRIRKMN